MKNDILTALKNAQVKLCVVTTVAPDNKPEAAMVGYAVADDLTIFLSTSNKSRKWQNLKENKHVALVFGWGFEQLNVQYEGIAEAIEQTDPTYNDSENFFFSFNPGAATFKTPDTVLIRIKPTWIRILDATVNPPKKEEKIF